MAVGQATHELEVRRRGSSRFSSPPGSTGSPRCGRQRSAASQRPAATGAVIRVSRTVHRRDAATGLWDTSSEVAYFVCEFLLPASLCAQAIRQHWAIENRSHYVRDGSFREDASRIRCNPGIFARLRSFATNILRFNDVENVSDTRYRITLGGLDALRSLHFM
jgi:predicted transposase YbfD/YdcC